MTTIQLTPAQVEVLTLGATRQGAIEPLPARLPAGACKKIITSLQRRGLVEEDLMLTDAGYAAIGEKRSTKEVQSSDIRANSKQATVIALLQRPEGASILQIMAATGWLSHTVRGCFAGTLRKKLNLTLTSEKVDGERRYRIPG